MFRKKDASILLFVLIGCAIIAFAEPSSNPKNNLPSEQQSQNPNQEKPRQFSVILEKTEEQSIPAVTNYYRLFENEDAAEPEPSEEEKNIKNEPLATISQTETAETNPVPENKLSLKSILAEIENMAAKIKFKSSGKETCAGCGGKQSQSETSGIPTCADILAAGAGACNCATLGCTPPDPPWCVHPCCCVCCPVCCR